MYNDIEYKEVLLKIKNKLSDSTNWTQGANARDSFHLRTPPDAYNAKCWCLQGAIVAVNGYTISNAFIANKMVQDIQKFTKDEYDDIVEFNDKNDYKQVMKFLNYAITKVGK